MKKSILIIGRGSSGLRFVKNLEKKFNILNVPSKKFRKSLLKKLYFDLIIISSPASFHVEHLLLCKNYADNFLIEKPLTNSLNNLKKIKNIKKKNFFVNYNLRELEIIKNLKRVLKSLKNKGSLNYCSVHCGYNLKYWRKKNINKTVAYSKKLGGGALFELSHELDLIFNFFGKPTNIRSTAKNLSKSVKDVEDILISNMYYAKEKILINLNLNFLDNYKKRYFEFVYSNCNIIVDLAKHKITIIKNNNQKVMKFKDNLSDTYKIIPTKILNKDYKNLCRLKESIKVSKFIFDVKNSIK